jgi:hypothetical protein
MFGYRLQLPHLGLAAGDRELPEASASTFFLYIYA